MERQGRRRWGTTGTRGNPVARAAAHWAHKTKQHRSNIFIGLRSSGFNFYDAGPRTAQLIKDGHQMMDMYYGADKNDLFRFRKPNIAGFVHIAIGFDTLVARLDINKSGRDSFFEAFGKGVAEGYKIQPATNSAYGHSATKEMSRIIRERIKEFGGKLIFEGKAVFGAGIFDPRAPYQGDTDLEAQDLFRYFYKPVTPRVPFGNGTLEFHWGGLPTTPTRAHFLTNWSFGGPNLVNRSKNRVNQDDKNKPWREYVEKVLGDRHELRGIWNNFLNFPPGMIIDNPQIVGKLGIQTNFQKMEMVISQLSVMLAMQHKNPSQ